MKLKHRALFFYFDILRQFNNHLPSVREAKWAVQFGWKFTRGVETAICLYSIGWTLETIAARLHVTRERVRQLVLKGCRNARLFVS